MRVMSPQKESSPEELTTGREARVAARRRDRHERYVHLLRLALRTRLDNGYPADKLEAVLKQGDDELEQLMTLVGGTIYPRRRPKAIWANSACTFANLMTF